MIPGSQTVQACTIGKTVTAGSNNGNGVCVCSTKTPDGLVAEFSLAETISTICSQDQNTGATAGNEQFTASGQFSQTDTLSFTWPAGSGSSVILTAANGSNNATADNLLTNSDFSQAFINGFVPDFWNVDVGTLVLVQDTTPGFIGGYCLEFAGNGSEHSNVSQHFANLIGNNAVQTVTLTLATGGYFTLTYDQGAGTPQTTGNIAWNAPAGPLSIPDGTSVQENLEALSNIGANNVLVTGSAGGPYTITFIGTLANQDISQLSADGTNLTGSTPTIATAIVTAGGGTAGVLLPETQYACSVWVRTSATPAAGVLTIDLATATGTGSVIQDQQGTNNSFTIALTSVSTAWLNFTGIFRTPYILPATAYIRVRLSTPLSSGKNAFINHLCLTPMTQVYAGGPSLAVFSGATPFYVPDSFGIVVTNDRGGSSSTLKNFQTLCQRLYSPQSLGLSPLPSSGSPTIADYT